MLPIANDFDSSILVRALAELGFVVCIFLTFAYGLASVLPMVFCGAIIISYTVVDVMDERSEKAQLIVLGSTGLITWMLLSFAIKCYVGHKTPENAQKCFKKSRLEFAPGRSFCEFLTRSKT